MRPALREECLVEGGTRIRVWLNKIPDERGGLLNSRITRKFIYGPVGLGQLCAWLAPALDVDLYAGGDEIRPVVAASDWLTIDGSLLLERLSFGVLEGLEKFCGPSLRIIKSPSGCVLGRATVFRNDNDEAGSLGVVVTGGIRAGVDRDIAGILVGTANGLARIDATPIIGEGCRTEWVTSQALVISENTQDPGVQAIFAKWILSLGGDSGALAVARMGNKYVSLDDLEHWENAPEEVVLARAKDGREISQEEIEQFGYESNPEVIVFPKEASPWVFIFKLARAWRCPPREIIKEIGFEYVVSPEGEHREIETFLLQRPEVYLAESLISK